MKKQVSHLTYHERLKVRQKHIDKVLFFLSEEIYSTSAILERVVALTQAPTNRILNSLLNDGYLSKGSIKFLGTTSTLWGITPSGLAEVGGDAIFKTAFDPNRIGIATLHHRVENQSVRVILEEKGWTNWRNADKKEFTEQYKEFKLNHRPDGVIHDQYDQPIAIETERTLKRRERYRAIMRNHILAKKHKLWAFVIYAVPTNKLKIALNAIFDDIEYVLLNGVRHEIKEQHRKMFKFYTYDELENLNLERKE